MPWTEKDAARYKKGIADKDKKKWVAVANTALKQCLDNKGDKLECEIQAIKIASARFGDTELTEARIMQFRDDTEKLKELSKTQAVNILLAEIASEESERINDGYQLILPTGHFYLAYYGEMVFTLAFIEAMVGHWKNRALNEREPFLDKNHSNDESYGWIIDLSAREDGLYAKIDWTEEGRRLVATQTYRYFSASIEQKMNIDTGAWLWPVLTSVALTNSPALNTMPRAQLTDEIVEGAIDNGGKAHENVDSGLEGSPAHGDGTDKDKEGDIMEFAEVLNAVAKFSDEEKKVAIKHLGLDTVEAEKASLIVENVALKTTNATLLSEKDTLTKVNTDLTKVVEDTNKVQVEARKKSVIDKALSEGRMLPKDRPFWETKFSENPDFAQSIIEKLPKVVILDESAGTDGHADADASKIDLSDVDKLVEANLAELGFQKPEKKE